ncbi:hypothetical protein D210916BOD24_23090 [Alteromonas sp. D210916BOD_24]
MPSALLPLERELRVFKLNSQFGMHNALHYTCQKFVHYAFVIMTFAMPPLLASHTFSTLIITPLCDKGAYSTYPCSRLNAACGR